MRLLPLLCIILVCATAAFPYFSKKVVTLDSDDVKKEPYYLATIANNTFYPFQPNVIINTPIPEYNIKIVNGTTVMRIDAQFLVLSNKGEMLPNFSIPLNSSVLTVRLHTMECYPEQGGYYYRNNTTIEFGDIPNELVCTRATDQNGFLNMTVSRNWEVTPSMAKSIVINTVSEGIIMCTNINWELVDGAFSSIVSITTLLAVMGLIMKQIFME